MERGLAEHGPREFKVIPYDKKFRLLTLPFIKDCVAKVHPGKGILVNYLWYWCEEFADGAVENTSVKVRYDPYDISVVYVHIGKKLVRCQTKHQYARLKGRTHQEFEMALNAIKAFEKDNRVKAVITAGKIAEFLEKLEKQAREMMMIRENKIVRDMIDETRPDDDVKSTNVGFDLEESEYFRKLEGF